MIGYILTIEQKDSIQKVQYAPFQLFNCVQDENDFWFTFLSDEDKEIIIGTQFEWILNLQQKEYKPKINKNGLIN
jgi:hypothetical protein